MRSIAFAGSIGNSITSLPASKARSSIFAGLIGVGHALHVQRIGKDQSVETEFILQHTGHDRLAQGARLALGAVQGGHLQVGHHHGG